MDYLRLQRHFDLSKGLTSIGARGTEPILDKELGVILKQARAIAEKANEHKKLIRERSYSSDGYIDNSSSLPNGLSNAESDLLDARFAVLAIIGEIGELIEAVSEPSENFTERVSEEIADTFSYFAKLCEAIDIDPEIAYLEKMLINAWRFPNRASNGRQLVAICGPVASGKSTTIHSFEDKGVGEQYWATYLERANANPNVPPLDSDSAAKSQRWFLQSLAGFLKRNSTTKTLIVEQSPMSIALVYGRLLYKRGLLRPSQYRKHLESAIMLENFISRTFQYRFAIFLESSTEELLRRISQRNSDSKEQAFEEDIIKEVVHMFEGVLEKLADRSNVFSFPSDKGSPMELANLVWKKINVGKKLESKLSDSLGEIE